MLTHFETSDLELVSESMRGKDFVDGAVIMLTKLSIINKLDGLDHHPKVVGACNKITTLPGGCSDHIPSNIFNTFYFSS